MTNENFQIYNENCLEGMKRLAEGSVDFICFDPPYQMTEFYWDKQLDNQRLWEVLKRVVKPRRAIAIFSLEPYASKLRLESGGWYKYDWIWKKNRVNSFMNAKNAPLKVYENILIFSGGVISAGHYNKMMLYKPQGVKLKPQPTLQKDRHYQFGRKNNPPTDKTYIQEYTNYPRNILEFKVVNKPQHPTQKPVDLLEYLIRTYTNEGEVVLDATMGSGSTGVACMNTGRKFIGFETEKKFFDIAEKRISEALAKKQQELFKLE